MLRFIGARRARTLAGLILFAGLSPFLLAVMACLEAPIGDPEQSAVDPAITGVWMHETENDALWLLEPWDQRTWISTWISLKESDASVTGSEAGAQDWLSRFEAVETADVTVFKTWLTEIGGVRFLVLEPKGNVHAVEGMTPVFWFAYELKQPDPTHLALRLVSKTGGASTTEEIEKYIAAHAKDGELFDTDPPVRLYRVPEIEYGRVGDVLKKLGVGPD